MSRVAALILLLTVLSLGMLWITTGGARGSAGRSAAPDVTPEDAGGAAELAAGTNPTGQARATLDVEPAADLDAQAGAARTPIEPKETRIWLHVRDRASGRALAPVFVAEFERWLEPERERPGVAGESAEERGASPVRLDAPEEGQFRTVFARSPGYAWGRIDLGTEQAERVLALDPGGDLHVRIVGGPRDPGTKLRVLSAEGRLLAELDLHTAEELEIVALPEGPVDVVAQLGKLEWPRELARERVEILARSPASVTLALEAVEAARWVPLAGSLVLPPEWKLDDFQLVFQLQGPSLERWPGRALVDRVEMTLAERETGLYLWDARSVQAGVYTVELAELGWGCVTVVGGNGTREARLVVGPPCDVRLRCLTAGTRAPAGFVELRRSSGPDSIAFSVPVTGWDEELGAFVFRAPSGPLRIDAPALGVTREFELRPGANELELEIPVRAAAGLLSLTLMDEDGSVPWDARRVPMLETLTGDPTEVVWSLEGSALVLHVTEPGTYRLRLPAFDGYEPVHEPLVEIEGRTELVLRLVRRR